MKPVYYNEWDKAAAAWLRELIKAGHIPAGDVDTRSIADVRPDDLTGYGQYHFFAGVGGWALALRLAGWPDDREIATGSCPCQPFSCAGRGGGVADERHLWPAFRWLIAQRRFAAVAGEQVASADGRAWLAGVLADLEDLGYRVGAADLCAAGVGAPHIRQRLYWVADADSGRFQQCDASSRSVPVTDPRGTGGLADAAMPRRDGEGCRQPAQPQGRECLSGEFGAIGGRLAAAERDGRGADQPGRGPGGRAADGRDRATAGGLGVPDSTGSQQGRTAATTGGHRGATVSAGGNGAWSDYGIVWCDERDLGRGWVARRVEPGTFPLVNGLPRGMVPGGDPGASINATAEARQMRLKGYGNAINPYNAAQFLAAYLETEGRAG